MKLTQLSLWDESSFSMLNVVCVWVFPWVAGCELAGDVGMSSLPPFPPSLITPSSTSTQHIAHTAHTYTYTYTILDLAGRGRGRVRVRAQEISVSRSWTFKILRGQCRLVNWTVSFFHHLSFMVDGVICHREWLMVCFHEFLLPWVSIFWDIYFYGFLPIFWAIKSYSLDSLVSFLKY